MTARDRRRLAKVFGLAPLLRHGLRLGHVGVLVAVAVVAAIAAPIVFDRRDLAA